MGGKRDWKTLPTESPRRVVRPLRINSATLVSKHSDSVNGAYVNEEMIVRGPKLSVSPKRKERD